MTTLLAGDVGGTKTILRLVALGAGTERRRAPLGRTLAEGTYRSADYHDLVPMVAAFLASTAEAGPRPAPGAACFAVAGPVKAGAAELTNLPWTLEEERLERELGIPRVALINDFVAVGHGVVALESGDLHTLQPGEPEEGAPIAVLGAGTGLGEAFVIPGADGHRVFATEGGHADFAPRSALELQLLEYLREASHLRRVSVERVVSGTGITSIYRFLRDRDAADESPALAASFLAWKRGPGNEQKTVDLAAEISRAALEGGDSLSRRTVRVFVEAFGAEAGNLALKLLPFGGLYVAGGIAPKILPLLEEGAFLEAFRDKGRMAPLLEKVPVHVVLESRVGLIGAVRHAALLPGV